MPVGFARFLVRRRRAVFVMGLLFMVVAGVFGGDVASRLSNGGFQDAGAPSWKARVLLEEKFRAGSPNLVLLVSASGPSGSAGSGFAVDRGEVAAAGRTLTEELAAEDGVDSAVSYWSLDGAPPLRSKDGTQALVLARIAGDEDEVRDRIETLGPRYQRTNPGVGAAPIVVRVTGEAEIFRQLGTTIEDDLKRAEMIAIPITLVLLVLVFGGLVAAGLPLLIGAITVTGTFLVLRLMTEVTSVSIFALNLTTAMGLGLAIDYALFVVSRHREEMAAGWSPADAAVRAVRTAGRTVVFSALTVAASLAALLVFPLAFLRSFAYAGIAVALLAALTSVTVLPALLVILGHRVDSLRVFRTRPRSAGSLSDGPAPSRRPGAGGDASGGVWHRIAMRVMASPGRFAIAGTGLLVVLGTPFLGIRFGLPDHRVLPTSASSRSAQDEISRVFESQEAGALEVVAPDMVGAIARPDVLGSYATILSRLDGVARVDTLAGSFMRGAQVAPPSAASARFHPVSARDDGTWLSVVPTVEPLSPEGERLVRAIRSTPTPEGMGTVVVGGPSAQLVDSKQSLAARLPLAGAIIALITFVVLFLLFGGLLVPIKALALNLLSLSATFGAMVWIFQEGHLSGALDFTATGTIDTTTPILMFCIAFGLSMDYEVFLLSRIKEDYDRTGDNTRSVAMGLERTGRIVTAAALLLAVVFVSFATSGVTFIKLFGLGLALAVLVDAFLIRAVLVPAFMRLAGDANWWAPRPLRVLQQRIGLSEHVDLEALEPLDLEPLEPEGAAGLVATQVGSTLPSHRAHPETPITTR